MKSRDTLIRLKRFQVDEKRRRVAQIEMMIADFGAHGRRSGGPKSHPREQKAGITDTAHFAYPTLCQGGRPSVRREPAAISCQSERRAR